MGAKLGVPAGETTSKGGGRTYVRKLKKIGVTTGVYWVEAPEAEVFMLCGCPEDAVKHLMLRGLILPTERDGVTFDTGPNAILLSDVMLQNGSFSNQAEFPVLQMLYLQGMLLPDHPNNTGAKPLLVGSADQLKAQKEYIYRGNYGLVSAEEIMETGATREEAEEMMRLKLAFAFGRIRSTDELLDSIEVGSEPSEIRNGVTIRRQSLNVFEIAYGDETVTVDLNLNHTESYRSPYPLGFQNIKREYFAVVHSGQGDGWDINRPAMSSILMYQGKIYLIDAGPNISYSLMALGIGVNEIEGVFHTHGHDDHFSGLTTLIRSDHRIKYYATPLVRASVFKKLSALLSVDESTFSNYFDIQDLQFGEWNDIEGLEVRPVFSPHPVETSVLFFRTFWEGRYMTYAHLGDIASFEVLEAMIADGGAATGISKEFYGMIKREYLAHVELKKIDIGGGMIHGSARDFQEDTSDKIVLAHQSLPLSANQKEIGSSAPFGIVDVLVPDYSDNLRRIAFEYLRAYYPTVGRHDLRKLLNNQIIEFIPGSIILKKGHVNDEIVLLLTGNVESINAEESVYNILSAGGVVGEYSGMHGLHSRSTFRAVSFVQGLRLPATSYRDFIQRNRLDAKIERLYEIRQFLQTTWLFGDAISPPVQNRVAEDMELRSFGRKGETLADVNPASLYIIKKGGVERLRGNEVTETLGAGDFFGEDTAIFRIDIDQQFRTTEPTIMYEVPGEALIDVPIILWKLLETHERRTR